MRNSEINLRTTISQVYINLYLIPNIRCLKSRDEQHCSNFDPNRTSGV